MQAAVLWDRSTNLYNRQKTNQNVVYHLEYAFNR